ncbi:MAG: hypothetical protein KDI48_14990, partial [Xanthomonadales bacterium]|nr:hypothetical protein [Xanthomonadales bacterium]
EGFVVESLQDGRTVVYWYTYDGEGQQRWFIGVARRDGMRLVVDELLATQGGIFGPMFDPSQVSKTVAGQLQIEFDSCNSGQVRYVVDGIEGSQDLIRLTLMKGLSCRDNQAAGLVAGSD